MKQLPRNFSVFAATVEEAAYISKKQEEICGWGYKPEAKLYYRFSPDSFDKYGIAPYSYHNLTSFGVTDEFTFNEFKAFFEPLMKITDLGENEVIHCPTIGEYNLIHQLMTDAGIEGFGDEGWRTYKSNVVIYPKSNSYADLDYAKERNCVIYNASQFIHVTTSMPMKNRITRGDLRELYNQFECSTWRARIDKYLKDSYLKSDDYVITISEADMNFAFAENNATSAQKNALKEKGVEFDSLFDANDLKSGEIIEAKGNCGDVKYVIGSKSGAFIYVYKSGLMVGVASTDIKGRKIPKGTKLETIAK